MSVFLLDVNVLIALAWPSHIAHTPVHRWFTRHGQQGWATCPIIECGFVRVISNAAFSTDALTPRDALALLGVNLSHPAHQFWRDDLTLHQALATAGRNITGHRQITDMYLLGLARHHKGRLATLDQAFGSLAGSRGSDVELISS